MTSGKRDAEIRAIVKPLWHYIDVKNPNKKLEIKPTMKKTTQQTATLLCFMLRCVCGHRAIPMDRNICRHWWDKLSSCDSRACRKALPEGCKMCSPADQDRCVW